MANNPNMFVTWERVALTAVAIALGVVGFIGRDLSRAVSGLDRTLTGFAAASKEKHKNNSKQIDKHGAKIEKLETRVSNLEKGN